MKKRIACILGLTLVLGLAGCGTKEQAPEEVQEENHSSVLGVSMHTNYLLWVLVGIGLTGLFILVLYSRERKLAKARRARKRAADVRTGEKPEEK